MKAFVRLCEDLILVSSFLRAMEEGEGIHVALPSVISQGEISRVQFYMDTATRQFSLPNITVIGSSTELSSLELAISSHLHVAGDVGNGMGNSSRPEELNRWGRDAKNNSLLSHVNKIEVQNSALQAYQFGKADQPTVVLVPPCGMPVALLSSWISELSGQFQVLTWETREMFNSSKKFLSAQNGLNSQIADLHAVMNWYGVDSAHIMGVCGGAVIALAAAGSCRVRSISLWHGDYEISGKVPKTQHQKDVESVLKMAASSRDQAKLLRKLFLQPATFYNLPGERACHLLYPYTNSELLYRYGHINGAIMSANSEELLTRVTQPVLVVTSEDDQTTHPKGSHFIAENLNCSKLYVRERGDHLSVFDADKSLVQLAKSFIGEISIT